MLSIRDVATRSLLAVLCAAALSRADDKLLSREYLDQVREAAGLLVRDLEHLQDVIVGEIKGEKERLLYRMADSALSEALTFEEAVKDGKREGLYKRFDALDEKLHKLLEGVKGLKEAPRSVQRAANYVHASDDQPAAGDERDGTRRRADASQRGEQRARWVFPRRLDLRLAARNRASRLHADQVLSASTMRG